MRSEPVLLFTVGHGASSEEDFRNLLRAAEVVSVVDVRIGPGSRKHPHFGKDRLEEWLPAAGIAYRWEQRLGGFRKLPPVSPDTALRNDSSRAYAAYMRTPGFGAALAEVLAEAAALLRSGTMSALLHHDLKQDIQRCCRIIMHAHGALPEADAGHASQIEVITPFNIPHGV